MNLPLIAFVNDVTGSRTSGCQVLWAESALHLQENREARVALAFRAGSRPDLGKVTQLLEKGCPHVQERSAPPGMAAKIMRRFWNKKKSTDSRIPSLLWLESLKPDLVVVCQSGCIGVDFWGPRLRKKNIPYVTLTQCADIHMWKPDDENDLLREGYLNALRNFFVSAGNRRSVETMLGIPLANSEVICNSFQATFDQHFTWPSQQSPLRLACVARLYPPAKGQDILLQALAGEKWKSRDVHLSLVGSGSCLRSLQQLVKTLGLEPQVTFMGHVRDISSIWDRHHLLVMPSRYEGMPLAVLEALLRGRPCVLTDVAGHAEYITEGENGFLAEAPTVSHLDAALERAWKRRVDLEEMGKQALARACLQIPTDPAAGFARKLVSLCSP
jgi:glycosyltransferase involved in cell wall biosynthesis